jgi:hypothetical protein
MGVLAGASALLVAGLQPKSSPAIKIKRDKLKLSLPPPVPSHALATIAESPLSNSSSLNLGWHYNISIKLSQDV